MSLTVNGCSGTKYAFEGPYKSTSSLTDNSGVYFIVCYDGTSNHPIDVGESETIKTRVETHERADCWKRHCSNTLMFAVYYTPNKQQSGRMEIEQDIRCYYNLPCGSK